MQKALRKCRQCGLEALTTEDLNFFQIGRKCLHGRHNFCKKCDNARARAEKAKDPEKWLKKKRNHSMIQKYGITLEQRANYVISVGKCEICGTGVTPETAHIDHSHGKMHIRGVLCNKCNTGLGKFGDSVDLLNKAMKYLIDREHKINPESFGVEKLLDHLYHYGKQEDINCHI
jgi:hypothetical protein